MLFALIEDAHKIAGLPGLEEKAKTNAKFASLVKKLRKQPGVRDPEALAAWLGRRKGGLAKKGKLRRKSR